MSDVDKLLDELARLRAAIEEHRRATCDESDVFEGRDLDLWSALKENP